MSEMTLASRLRSRIGQEFDGECHLSEAEARAIAAALDAAREALRDNGATLSAIRAETQDEHFYKLCGEQLGRNVEALAKIEGLSE